MTELIQTIVFGLLVGGVYALLASGLTLIFGVMNVINVAHGAFLILAAFLTFSLWSGLGLDPLVAIVITTPVMFAFGWLVYMLTVRPIRRAPPSSSVLLTFGLALVLEAVMGLIWGNNSHSARPSYFNESFDVGGIVLPKAQVFACAVAVVVLAACGCSWPAAGSAGRSAPRPSTRRERCWSGSTSPRVSAMTFAVGVAAVGAGGSLVARALSVPARVALHLDRPAARDHRARRDGQLLGRDHRRAGARPRRDVHPDLRLARVGDRGAVRDHLPRPARAPAGDHGHPAAGGRGDCDRERAGARPGRRARSPRRVGRALLVIGGVCC